MPAGRPCKYNQEILDKAKDYVANHWPDYEDIVPSVAGLAYALNIAKSTVYDWSDHEDKKEFSDTLGHLLNKQEKMLLAGGLATSDHADVKSMNPTIVKLMLANHDYSDKTTNEHTGADGGPIETKTSFNFIPVGKND